MAVTRRDLLSMTLAAAATLSTPGARAESAFRTPWRNWSGALHATPASRVAPASTAELQRFLRAGRSPLRPVGAGHSFSPLVPTQGDLLVLDRLQGLGDVDATTLQAQVRAGTRLSQLGPLLDDVGQACWNMPDIDRQTLAGALSTATHGTGDFRSLSGYVTALRLVTVEGELLELDAEAEADVDLFHAAAVSLGTLGIITEATLANTRPLRLKSRSVFEPLETVLAEFEARVRNHRHFEFFPLPYCDFVSSLTIDETDAPIHNPAPTPEEDAAMTDLLRTLLATPIMARRVVFNRIVESLEPSEAVDRSYGILCNIRNQRFNEMEYSVPAAAGMACVRELMDTISERRIDVTFPLEVRYIAGDECWLSMMHGGPRVSISVHEFADRDHRPYFDAVEPVFWKYGGRPHWGKVHSLGHEQLTELYPRFEDFRALRARLDPRGRLLNDHLRTVFGA
ncbi:MAG: D-arabinono-1,4-lactone oxidase [Pseudomonadales bacterium]|jgi:FAD-linked oxidoreductase|nr:D-arabinono-1,4-lactone oxidase [Pseudomonadales bacterium]